MTNKNKSILNIKKSTFLVVIIGGGLFLWKGSGNSHWMA